MTLEDLGYDPSLDTYRKEKQKEYNSEIIGNLRFTAGSRA